jgi:enoyl-CoA hydratase/carnithine racemase
MTRADVEIERRGAVEIIRFNRPDRGNAWSEPMGRQFYGALHAADRDPGVRAIVITGAGRSFCVGGDVSELDEIAESGTVGLAGRSTRLWTTTRLRKPVIAAINGGCAGLGFVQALMCDIRFAARRARLTTAYARVGLPAEQAISWVLPRVAGVSNALDLLFSARTFDAEEALRLGVVNRVAESDVVEEAVEYGRMLAATSSPASMASMKRQVWRDLERGLHESADIADELTDHHVAQGDFRAGVVALQRRAAPEFSSLAEEGWP